MPYIRKEDRLALLNRPAESTGELNYKISDLIVDYVTDEGLSYKTINDVIGALEGAKLEFYRRVAAPYEDGAIKRNGDIYHDC